MISTDTLADLYRMQVGLLAHHVADFSDADMLVRPVAGANHAAWQIGHLSVATAWLINTAMPGALPTELPEFVERYTAKGSKLDDGFAGKDELLKKLTEVTERAVAWMRGLSDADRARPVEPLKGFAPTVAHVTFALPAHVNMHIGQIQVIRRKLGKPNLF